MNETPGADEIRAMVARHISEALLVPIKDVVPSARLLSDLKAESIDIADLRFRVEGELKMKIDQRAMIDSLGKDLTAEEFDNRFTVGFVIDYVIRHFATDRSPA